ncbi:type IV pilus twitching motility protein PilT [Pseudanabaena mucicola]|uniref:Type IV pilus twitching motility protein PilT n=1 Tax=Pseudanabaena mucicola FACHB-723 TaxID=2692860 RepID=A0ABR7ZZ59_9CYAN|nr:type IV pilus twitching motility protein PilT [Pseudanabaena mucicola]MBD2188775.1 type IV pilus twitching motility protein PilT [Pseudanabaena mucicola FACHB-723]
MTQSGIPPSQPNSSGGGVPQAPRTNPAAPPPAQQRVAPPPANPQAPPNPQAQAAAQARTMSPAQQQAMQQAKMKQAQEARAAAAARQAQLSIPTDTQITSVPPPPNPRPPIRPGPPPNLPGIGVPAILQRSSGQPTLAQIVRDAHEQGCSDIHAGVNEPIRFRSRGLMVTQEQYPVPDKPTFDTWLTEIMDEKQIQQFRDTLEFDGATQYEFARCRINIFDSLRGAAMVLRLIPLKILSIDQLGLPEVFRELCYTHKGLILVTGPTGSGKSTTLAAMVDFINSEMQKHLISIEDPIEFVHQSKKALIKQREVGIHTLKFDNALKAALREDPDIILIGEMRDKETVNTALKAAQTGHLVFGTLHTNSAVKTIERILNLYEPEQQGPMRIQVAESLVGVIAQSLVRTTDGKRAAVHEIMINTDAVRDYIKRGDVDEIEAIIPKCTYEGMVNMNQSLYKLYEDGRITEETAVENSPKPNEMAQMLRGRM